MLKAMIVPKEMRRLQEIVGLGADPDAKFLPLGECEGDCDDDSQCEPGLICFQRSPNDSVPGCEGSERVSSDTDFCVRPMGRSDGDSGGLGLCEGDCDNDSQVSEFV
jgi:hypothetical protein